MWAIFHCSTCNILNLARWQDGWCLGNYHTQEGQASFTGLDRSLVCYPFVTDPLVRPAEAGLSVWYKRHGAYSWKQQRWRLTTELTETLGVLSVPGVLWVLPMDTLISRGQHIGPYVHSCGRPMTMQFLINPESNRFRSEVVSAT